MGQMVCTYRCIACGDVMINVGRGRKYCDRCRKDRARENRINFEAKRRGGNYVPGGLAEKFSPPSPQVIREHAEKRAAVSDALLRENCRVADWAGISYGTLMVQPKEAREALKRQYYEAVKQSGPTRWTGSGRAKR